MPTDLTEEVLAFVSEEVGVPLARLTPDTRVVHDLGCDGDDAGELLERFSEKFNVDLSTLQWHRHFSDEGGPGCGALLTFTLRLLRGLPQPQPDHLEPVTMRDLVKAAEAKRWLK
jgi:acyl carrier protein